VSVESKHIHLLFYELLGPRNTIILAIPCGKISIGIFILIEILKSNPLAAHIKINHPYPTDPFCSHLSIYTFSPFSTLLQASPLQASVHP